MSAGDKGQLGCGIENFCCAFALCGFVFSREQNVMTVVKGSDHLILLLLQNKAVWLSVWLKISLSLFMATQSGDIRCNYDQLLLLNQQFAFFNIKLTCDKVTRGHTKTIESTKIIKLIYWLLLKNNMKKIVYSTILPSKIPD
jgi:hypothetical protein